MRPAQPDFWPREMTRGGDHVTRGQMADAWYAWQGGRYTGLVSALRRVCPRPTNSDYPYHRVADAMVQRARKAGLIYLDGRNWIERN